MEYYYSVGDDISYMNNSPSLSFILFTYQIPEWLGEWYEKKLFEKS